MIIPALDAAATLLGTLDALGASADEVVVVDGGSTDATATIARARGARVVAAPRGRGSQLAGGITVARHPWLLLLHADTRLGIEWARAASAHMGAGAGRAGYFRFVLDSPDPRARRLERAVRWRCSALALPYGDQGLLIHRDLLAGVGGMRPLPLMEDVDLVRRLGGARLAALDADALTSAAKWERDGWRRRSTRNLACVALWFAGVPPHLIARAYR